MQSSIGQILDVSNFLDVTIDEPITSTLKRPRGRSCLTSSPFRRPVAAKPRGPVLATCDKCGAQYRTLRYYNRHVQAHQLKELASRVPDVHGIKEKCLEICSKALEAIASKPTVYGRVGAEFSRVLADIKMSVDQEPWREVLIYLSQLFSVLLSSEKFTMPSAMRQAALKVVDDVLTSPVHRDFIMSALNSIVVCDESVCDGFLCEFVFNFADKLLIYILRCLRDADCNPHLESDIILDSEQRQCIFYIGGSIFHKFRLFGTRHPMRKNWQSIIEVIDRKVLTNGFWESMSDQHKEDRQWTEQRSRGGLKFVSEKVQSFLLSVARIIITEREVDGSLPVDSILKKVVCSDPKFDWDSAIGDALSPDLSLTLMIGVVKSLVSTYGRGIVKQFLNATNNKCATVSITLRHRVAPC